MGRGRTVKADGQHIVTTIMQPKIAVTFASGLLAGALIEQMVKAGISSDCIVLLDESEQAGARLGYGETYLTTLDQYEYDYEDLIAVLLLQPDEELEGLFQHADFYVISHHANDELSPVLFADLEDESSVPQQPSSIKLPSPELAILMSVIKPMQTLAELESLQVVNVLSAASYGKPAIDELASQTIDLLNSQDVNCATFPVQLAFNMIPARTSAVKLDHLQHLVAAPDVKVSMQNIIVPAFHGICMSVALEFSEEVAIEQIESLLEHRSDVELTSQTVTPVTHCKSAAKLHIYDLFQSQNDAKRLQFWVISDWVRNGLIQNYLKVTEILLKSYL